jgi:hypothetical protein
MASIDGNGKADAPGDQLVEKEREVQELRRILEQERALARHWRYVASHAAHQNELPNKTSSPSIEGHPGTVLPTLTVSEPPPRKSSFVALPLTAPTQLEGATGVNDGKNAAGAILNTSELDLKRLMGTSVIREIGVENHFKNLASTLGESRRNISSTSVQIQDLSLSYMVEQSNKRFLNVGEALLNPFLALLRSGGKKQTFQVKALQHITTAFAPQKLYLVIGGPKCGKTSLLKAIAGRSLRGTGYRLSGSVLYNGEEAGSGGFHMTSLACFVEEVDNNEVGRYGTEKGYRVFSNSALRMTDKVFCAFSLDVLSPTAPSHSPRDTRVFRSLHSPRTYPEAASDGLWSRSGGVPRCGRGHEKGSAGVSRGGQAENPIRLGEAES